MMLDNKWVAILESIMKRTALKIKDLFQPATHEWPTLLKIKVGRK